MSERETQPAASDDATLHKPQSAAPEPSGAPTEALDQTLVKPPGAPTEAHDQTLVKPTAAHVDTNLQTLQVTDQAEVARRAAAAVRQISSPAEEFQKKDFGDYELLSVIAKGGMGVVYKARQRKLNRIVAIKMILAGQLADSMDVERFYTEAEAAANLRHPNIVGIYEIGEINGQHFFSMQYIAGESLSEMVRVSPLDPQQAARYTKTIALAMQFAHEQGILHRDMKPSNVLIDGAAEPMITDFGLAKKVESESELTMTGTIVGTPSYMPPEQARGEIEKIDARSDVYSTGAILYELITGVPPFRAANPFETIRQVLSVEPPAPRVVNPSIPKDLETICLKALEKDADARYASEQHLADELQRFLKGEPILARPISPVARLWRWCRRNPVIASLASATFLFMVLALVGTSVGYVRATIAKREADVSFRHARAAADDMFTRVSEDTLLNSPGMQSLRHSLLNSALEYYLKFAEQRGDDPSVRQELANTYYRVGYITGEIQSQQAAIPWYDKALAIQLPLAESSPSEQLLNDLGETWNGLGIARQKIGEPEAAEAAYDAAIEVRRQVVALDPSISEYHRELANSQMNMGLLLREGGEFDQARQLLLDAQQIRSRQLAKDDADAALRRDLAQGYYNLARLEWGLGELQAADDNFAAAESEFSRLLDDAPKDLWNQWRLGTVLRLRADLSATRLDPDTATTAADGAISPLEEALEQYQRAGALIDQLALRNPDVVQYQEAQANLLMNQGRLLQYYQRDNEALPTFERAVEVLRALAAEQDGVVRYRRDLAVTQAELAELLALAGRFSQAVKQITESEQSILALAEESTDPEQTYRAQRSRIEQVREWIEEVRPENPD